MKGIKKRIAGKLKNTAGESLAEVLIALLIAALAMAMLATAISSTAKIVTQSKATMKNYYNGNTALDTASSGGTRSEVTVIIPGTEPPRGVQLTDEASADGTFIVNTFQNAYSTKVPVVFYKLSS